MTTNRLAVTKSKCSVIKSKLRITRIEQKDEQIKDITQTVSRAEIHIILYMDLEINQSKTQIST